MRAAFGKARNDAVRACTPLYQGALRHRNQRTGKITLDARARPYFDFAVRTDAARHLTLDDHGIGPDVADPKAVRADQEHTVEIAITLDPAMHDVIVVSFDHANMHDLAAKNGGRELKLVETAAA
jgi:hypothetical protein